MSESGDLQQLEPKQRNFNWLRIFAILFVLALLATSALWSRGGEEVAREKPKPIKAITDLPNRIVDIQALAWFAMTEASAIPVANPMPVKLMVAPKSGIGCAEESIEIIRAVENAFKNTVLPKSVTLLFANSSSDKAWLTKTTGELLARKYRSYLDGEEINPETVNDRGEGVLWVLDPCRDNGSLSSEDQTQVAHGFAHVIQTMQFTTKDSDWARWGEVPRWILEGGATFVHNFWINRVDLATYENRTENLGENLKLDSKFYFDYLKYDPSIEPLWKYTDQWDNQRAYDIGSYVCQVLVALRGPQSIMELYGDYLKTEDFNLSFQNIYGMTWDEAHPIIAESIFKMIRATGKRYMPWYDPDKQVKI